MAGVISNFEDIIKQDPSAWKEASPEQRDDFIRTWARRRAADEGVDKPQMEEWLSHAARVGEAVLSGGAMPPVPASPGMSWWEYPLRALEAPTQFLQESGRVTDKGGKLISPSWRDPVRPFVHAGKYVAGGEAHKLPSGLPGPEWAQRMYMDPLAWAYGGAQTLHAIPRFVAKRAPMVAKGVRAVKSAVEEVVPKGGAAPTLEEFLRQPTQVLRPPTLPVAKAGASPAAAKRIIVPPTFGGARPTPTIPKPLDPALVRRLDEFLKRSAQRQPPVQKTIPLTSLDPALKPIVGMEATAAEQAMGMAPTEYAKLLKGL